MSSVVPSDSCFLLYGDWCHHTSSKSGEFVSFVFVFLKHPGLKK